MVNTRLLWWLSKILFLYNLRQPIILPAVKSGALFDSMDKTIVNNQQEQEKVQLSGLPTCDSTVTKTEKKEDTMNSSGSTPDIDTMSVEAEITVLSQVNDITTSDSSSTESTDDEDFLDLLVDTLDGEFDPELLIWSDTVFVSL